MASKEKGVRWLTALKRWIVVNKRELRGLGVFQSEGEVYLYYQAKKSPPDYFQAARSSDGFSFELFKKRGFILTNKGKEEISNCRNFQLAELDDLTLLSYQKRVSDDKLYMATSECLFHYEQIVGSLTAQAPGKIVSNSKYKNNILMYGGEGSIFFFYSKNLKKWRRSEKPVLEPRPNMFDRYSLQVEYAAETDKGILVLYHSKKTTDNSAHFSVGAALFDKKNPEKILWRSSEPVWEQAEEWNRKEVAPIGVVNLNGKLISYWSVANEGIWCVVYSYQNLYSPVRTKHVSLNLSRYEKNPIISPNKKNRWEASNTFNAAAIYEGEKVHLLYRAQGYDYQSVLGYASSPDGVHIDERHSEPAYLPREEFEYIGEVKPRRISHMYMSGGGYGGIEDPRLTKIDNRIYMTYVAFNGYSPPRLALTSISVEDFLNHRFLWEKPVLISPPGVVDKNGCILPEKVNGKYVIFHRIYPNILIDFVDSLEFDGTFWLEGEYKIEPRADMWDSRKIGAGAPPLKTDDGWLFIYQSVGNQDPGRYKIGAMLLDLDDPTKVLHRTNAPILEPDYWYENEGFKAGVAYPCGAVIIEDRLFVYYGGADSVVCVATANLEQFLTELKYSEIAKLEPALIQKVM